MYWKGKYIAIKSGNARHIMSENTRPFIISTDTTADLPEDFVKENKLTLHRLHYIVDGVTYGDDCELDINDFFDRMKSCSHGYASLDYEAAGYQRADLVKMDILLNGKIFIFEM